MFGCSGVDNIDIIIMTGLHKFWKGVSFCTSCQQAQVKLHC